MTHKQKHAPAWLLIVLCVGLIFTPSASARVLAQAPDGGWSPPVNVSQAGASSSPTIVTSPDGVTHVNWNDEFSGGRYASLKEGVWNAPVASRTPFGISTPRLIAGKDNYISALWIDNGGSLRYSRVSSKTAGSANPWVSTRLISPYTLSFDVELDADGIFHVVYTTSADWQTLPAGVYYIQGPMGGTTWSISRPIYTSPYFRSLTAENAPRASVTRLDAGGTEDEPGPIFVAWDDPSQGKILLSRTIDDGKTWEPAQAIDQPDETSGSTTPGSVDMTVWDDELMLVWKKSASAADCTMLYQKTTGGGSSWTSSLPMFEDANGCPTQSKFLGGTDEMLLWQATINNQVYLAAWNGKSWSALQVQADLSGVKDPGTARTLATGCLQLEYLPEQNQLNAIRCDTDGNLDIWYTSKPMDEMETWFSEDTSWSAPATLTSIDGAFSALSLFNGEGNIFYSMWTQPDPDGGMAPDERPYALAMYSVWNGETWSEPAPTFRLRGGGIYEMATTLSTAGDLYAVWRGENPGQIFTTRANAARAFSSVEWSEAKALPTPDGPCVNPTIVTGDNEEVYIAYAVPVNEVRGIYLNYSSDGGREWSEPVQIFDAQAAGWELVGKPVLRRSADGQIHAFWQQKSLLMGEDGSGLGYARSSDGGITWSEADLSIEARVRWHSLAATAQGSLLRIWQEIADGVPLVAAQTSVDGGSTWQAPVSITISGEMMGDPSVITDAAGGIHLLQMNRNNSGGVVLSHWIWYNNGWKSGETVDIEQGTFQSTGAISSSISSQDKLAVIYTADDSLSGGQALQAVIGDTEQAGAAMEQQPRPTATVLEPTSPAETDAIPTPAIRTSPTPEQTPTGSPSVTPTLDLTSGGSLPSSTDDNWSGLILGSVLAVIIVAIVFGYRIIQSRRRDYR